MSGAEPRFSSEATLLRIRFCLAPLAGANLSQIDIRVDPGGMIVVEVELDGIVTHWRGARDFDHVLSMNGKRVGRDFYRRRRVTACGTRTTLAQIGVRISRFVPVTPLDEHTARGGQLDASRYNVHRVLKEEAWSSMTLLGWQAINFFILQSLELVEH